MLSLRKICLFISMTALIVVLAACGSTTAGSTTSSSSSGYGSTSSGVTPTPTPSALVNTGTVTINGQSETVLTNAAGYTLYYFKPDTTTKSACTAACAGNWPPLLATGTPTSAATLSGTLAAVSSANGNQVQYNGHFLYTFVKDTAPGQANGQGIKGVWFVATPSLAVLSATPALINTGSVTINGQSETVLTNAAGYTLYYFKPDTATKAACTASCAGNWPPLLATGTPTSAATLSGTLTAVNSTNGNQVQYNGHFLYTFVKDTAPGQANGQGLGGVWFVATPSLS